MFVRRHRDACVLTFLAERLRTGDVAVAGAQPYANWADQLLQPATGPPGSYPDRTLTGRR